MKTIQRATLEELEAQILQGRSGLRTERMNISCGELISWYSRGDLVLRSFFERTFHWNSKRKTLFIESLLLGIPTPPIFITEGKEGNLEIIDGLQRVVTLLSFFGELRNIDNDLKVENNWLLSKGGKIEGLEGYNWMELPQKHRFSIRRYALAIDIVYLKEDGVNLDTRLELFNRLNLSK